VTSQPTSRRRIVLLGATGSIGRQTLAVAARYPDRMEIVALAAGGRAEALAAIAVEHQPAVVALGDPAAVERFRARARGGWDGELLWGASGVRRVAAYPAADVVVNGIVGAAGLPPSLAALEAGHRLALANKESLVMAGHLLRRAQERNGAELLPVDSEHSAVFACLAGRSDRDLARIILTASGGPFRTSSPAELEQVTAREALRHPTWRMGPRISVDSATLFNKGLEMIEACWLFGLTMDRIGVWVHPQSILHALVELRDGSMLAQLAPPDMRLPIQQALSHPESWGPAVKACDLAAVGRLDFEAPDPQRFPCLGLAQEAFRQGGTMPAVANAADEVLVGRFLAGEIPFLGIPAGIEAVMAGHSVISDPSLEQVLAADQAAREMAADWTSPGRAGAGRPGERP